MDGQVGEPFRHGTGLPPRTAGDEDGDRRAHGMADAVHHDLPVPRDADDQHIDLVVHVRSDALTRGKGHQVGVQVAVAREVPTDPRGAALVSHLDEVGDLDPSAGRLHAMATPPLEDGLTQSGERVLIEAILEQPEEAALLESNVVVQELAGLAGGREAVGGGPGPETGNTSADRAMLVAHALRGGAPLRVVVGDDRQQELLLDREVVLAVLVPEPVEPLDGIVELGAGGSRSRRAASSAWWWSRDRGARALERFIR